jgi:hypothetical protein
MQIFHGRSLAVLFRGLPNEIIRNVGKSTNYIQCQSRCEGSSTQGRTLKREKSGYIFGSRKIV